MKEILRLFAVFAAALILAAGAGGCSTPWETAKKNVENSRNLRVGMTKNEVLEVMGEPIRDEKFCDPNLWFYYVEMVWGDGLVTPEECLPLVFEDGKLIGWGNDFYLDHQIRRRTEDPAAGLARTEAAKKPAKAPAKKSVKTPAKATADKPANKPAKKSGAEKPKDHAGTSGPDKK